MNSSSKLFFARVLIHERGSIPQVTIPQFSGNFIAQLNHARFLIICYFNKNSNHFKMFQIHLNIMNLIKFAQLYYRLQLNHILKTYPNLILAISQDFQNTQFKNTQFSYQKYQVSFMHTVLLQIRIDSFSKAEVQSYPQRKILHLILTSSVLNLHLRGMKKNFLTLI